MVVSAEEYDIAYTRAAARFPDVSLSVAAFADFCRERGASPKTLLERAGDLFVCCAALEEDRAALTYLSDSIELTRAAIKRVRPDPEFVADTLQDLQASLLLENSARLQGYRGTGPLSAWLSVVATRFALDKLRRGPPELAPNKPLTEHFSNTRAALADFKEPESAVAKAQFTDLFQEALGRAIQTLSVRDRGLLRMHLQGRCTIDQIGRAHSVHRATAARWLASIREQVYSQVRNTLKAEYSGLTDGEFNSIAKVVQSQLRVDLTSSPSPVPFPS